MPVRIAVEPAAESSDKKPLFVFEHFRVCAANSTHVFCKRHRLDKCVICGDKDVIVVNTPSQPVPVMGAVGVSGTVQAQQSGIWTVGISGTPTVNVASSLNNPVFVRNVNDAEQPFTAEVVVSMNKGDLSAFAQSGPVPQGKRLVLQTVGVRFNAIPITQTFGLNVLTKVNGNPGIYPLTPTQSFAGFFAFTPTPGRYPLSPRTTFLPLSFPRE